MIGRSAEAFNFVLGCVLKCNRLPSAVIDKTTRRSPFRGLFRRFRQVQQLATVHSRLGKPNPCSPTCTAPMVTTNGCSRIRYGCSCGRFCATQYEAQECSTAHIPGSKHFAGEVADFSTSKRTEATALTAASRMLKPQRQFMACLITAGGCRCTSLAPPSSAAGFDVL